MLKKENLSVGSVYEVRADRPLSDGLASLPGVSGNIPVVSAHSGYVAGDTDFSLQPGDLCEIVQGPKKKNGVNIVQVKSLSTGDIGCVFWCEFRCNLVEPVLKSRLKL